MGLEPRQGQVAVVQRVGMNLEPIVKENFVLRNYRIDCDRFSENVLRLIWIQNQGHKEDVGYHTALLDQPEIFREQLVQNPTNLFLLKLFYKQIEK